MALVSRSLLLFGAVLLVHAAYSAHEHTQLLSSISTPPVSPQPILQIPHTSGLASLPLDITIETIVSVLLLCIGIVGGSEELKPIKWRVWAGQIEKRALEGKETEKAEAEGYAWLDSGRRRGFLDMRAQRKEFAEWAKGQSGA